jgi:hypothetical protein
MDGCALIRRFAGVLLGFRRPTTASSITYVTNMIESDGIEFGYTGNRPRFS